MAGHLFSLWMRLVWREDAARLLRNILGEDGATGERLFISNIPNEAAREAPVRLFFENALRQASHLNFASASLQYALRWPEVNQHSLEAKTRPLPISRTYQDNEDPYRSASTGAYRLIEMFIGGQVGGQSGEQPTLELAGLLSVGASIPHTHSKITLLFEALKATRLVPVGRLWAWWRTTPKPEYAPLSFDDVSRLDARLTAL